MADFAEVFVDAGGLRFFCHELAKIEQQKRLSTVLDGESLKLKEVSLLNDFHVHRVHSFLTFFKLKFDCVTLANFINQS